MARHLKQHLECGTDPNTPAIITSEIHAVSNSTGTQASHGLKHTALHSDNLLTGTHTLFHIKLRAG
jgi:hypothetical protein